MSTDGEVVNALVCKTSTHGFKSHSVLHKNQEFIRPKLGRIRYL